jgi:hypothetical protein
MEYINCNFLEYNLVDQNHVIRLGSLRDGGYYATKRLVESSDFLLSGGISYNAEFERDFKNINSASKIIMVDGSFNLLLYLIRPIYWMLFKKSYLVKIPYLIDMLLLKKESIFLKDYIGVPNGLSIEKIVSQNNLLGNGFLKLDIEGSEYNVISEILSLKNRFNGVAIEFHDVPDHIVEINYFIANIDMVLIGFCINETGKLNQSGIPNTIELSFAKEMFVTPNAYDTHSGKVLSNEGANELLIPVYVK